MSGERSVRLRAHAKVNLCLEVLGRRADGYHDLATIFQAVGLYDPVTVEMAAEGAGIEVQCEGWPVPGGRENLCWRAAEAFAEAAGGLPGKVTVRVTKLLPVGGGLGGGSSNAAAVLVGLNHLMGEPLTGGEVALPAARLGSDVAFFASGAGAAMATGRGEVLTPLPGAWDLAMVVVWPGEPVSTAWAYGLLGEGDFTDGRRARGLAVALAAGAPVASDEALGFNAFMAPVAGERSDVREALAELAGAGARKVSVAGSGACVWGVFEDEEQADRAAEALRAKGRWAHATTAAHEGVAIADDTDF
jgi:4-diphosphocytidyl-2-C-methyl-D-erythritol kinase